MTIVKLLTEKCMRNRSFFKGPTMILAGVALLLLVATAYLQTINHSPPLNISKQKSALNVHSSFWKVGTLGNKRLASSLLWVQTLLESDLEHYKGKDLNSWMYLRFNTITNLDPHFYDAYLYGGQYLSVVKDDPLGAAAIFEKGLKQYPQDYELNYYAAFNYYFELKDVDRALDHYERIIGHPRMPQHLPSLIAKLRAKKGDLLVALELIRSTYRNTPGESPLKKHFFRSLLRIQTQFDLQCLNSGGSKCATEDLLGRPYPKNKKGAYQAPLQ